MSRRRRQYHSLEVRESDFQHDLIRAAELLGWTVWWTPDSRRTNAGEPDLRLVQPPRMIFAELKTGRRKRTAEQLSAAEQLSLCPGVEYYLWTPEQWDDIMDTLA